MWENVPQRHIWNHQKSVQNAQWKQSWALRKTTFSHISYILGTIFHAGLNLGTFSHKTYQPSLLRENRMCKYVVMNPATFSGK